MKTIVKSILFTAILALAITGCQKTDENLDVSLKVATPYDLFVASWSPAGGAAPECVEASRLLGIPNCGLSFKVDPWVDDDYASGISINNSDENSFDWDSDGPVCIIIVKAGTGAYLYKTNGATSGSIELPYKAKGISHVSFCYGPPVLKIAVKFVYTDGANDYYGISDGTNVFSSDWCSEWFLGVNNYPSVSPITLHRAGIFTPSIGTLTIDALGDVTINLNAGLSLVSSALFVGTEADLTSHLAPYDNCPAYYALPWIYRTSGDLYFFDLPSL